MRTSTCWRWSGACRRFGKTGRSPKWPRRTTDGISVAVYEGLGDIPFYNETSTVPTHRPPPQSSALRLLRRRCSGDHAGIQRQHSAVVKNAIDWCRGRTGRAQLTAKPARR